jgi:hypothetical protein
VCCRGVIGVCCKGCVVGSVVGVCCRECVVGVL